MASDEATAIDTEMLREIQELSALGAAASEDLAKAKSSISNARPQKCDRIDASAAAQQEAYSWGENSLASRAEASMSSASEAARRLSAAWLNTAPSIAPGILHAGSVPATEASLRREVIELHAKIIAAKRREELGLDEDPSFNEESKAQ